MTAISSGNYGIDFHGADELSQSGVHPLADVTTLWVENGIFNEILQAQKQELLAEAAGWEIPG